VLVRVCLPVPEDVRHGYALGCQEMLHDLVYSRLSCPAAKYSSRKKIDSCHVNKRLCGIKSGREPRSWSFAQHCISSGVNSQRGKSSTSSTYFQDAIPKVTDRQSPLPEASKRLPPVTTGGARHPNSSVLAFESQKNTRLLQSERVIGK